MGKQPTYQELLAAYNKLLIENEYLHKEVNRLQSLLNSKGTHSTPPTMKRHREIRLSASMPERMGQAIM